MKISNRERGKNQGFSAVKTKTKVKLKLDLNVLDLMCSFCVSPNRNIRRSHLINLRNLIEVLDLEVYLNDMNKMDRLRFIKKALELRLNKGITSPELLISGATGGIVMEDETSGEFSESFADISNSEMDYLNEMIAGALKRTFLENSVDKCFDIITRYKTGDYRYAEAMVQEWEEFIKEEHNRIRSVRIENSADTVFNLHPDKYNDVIDEIYDKLSSPSRLLWTGMQGFNMLVGEALEATRVYLLLGLAGVGKSLTLLDLALQIKKYNKNFKAKDPTKIPTILYLTQENNVDETVERIFSMLSSGGKMKNYSREEVKSILSDGGLFISEEDNINIIIMFKPDRSIDTGDLYTILEDLEDDGYEVILLLQDHIKRILPVSHNPDIRLSLGETVNEIKVVAQLKEIPVISVAHLNRDAAKTVDENARGNKQDLTRLLGRGNVGESMLMIDNADCVIIINVEYDSDGRKHMIFKGVKLRNAAYIRDYICQPYELNNSAKLVEDLHSAIPAFKEALASVQSSPINMNMNPNIRVTPYSDISEMDDNIFNPSGSSYNMNYSPNINIPPIGDIFNIEVASTMPALVPKIISMEKEVEPQCLIIFTNNKDGEYYKEAS